jgi:hypothetical protein
MSTFACRIALVAASFALACCPALAEEPTLSVKGMPASQDSTITIRKGDAAKTDPDYRIESGSEEISGDPVAGQQESYKSWKDACTEWKKEMREMNKATLIALNCGTPSASRDSSSRVTQKSTGTYKIKVRIRESAAPSSPSGD